MNRSIRFSAFTALAGLLVSAAAALAADPAPKPATPKVNEMTWTGILSEEEFKALHTLREDKSPAPRFKPIDLAGGKAYLSLPEGKGPFPGLIVIHEWYGLNDHIRHWADRLAADGYAALAVDLYDGHVATTSDEAMALMKKVDEKRAREILAAAEKFLGADDRIKATKVGSIGWCFGGGWSLDTALSSSSLDAAVIYYGRLVTDPESVGKIKAPICGVFGNRDEGIPPASVDAFEKALKDAGVRHEIWRYDADHAFANPSGARYDEANATAAWGKVRAFLARELKSK